MSFPKGGRKKAEGESESILDCARREWSEETGISLSRVGFLPGAYLDEARTGTRYFLAWCGPPALSSDEPDAACERKSWKPPREDPADDDPIESVQWVRVEDAVQLHRSSVLVAGCVALLKEAVELLRGLTGVRESC